MNLARATQPETVGDALREVAAYADAQGVADMDVYGDSAFMQAFEARVAETLGKPAAVFMPSGVMAQQVALLVHAGGRAGAFGAHATSHLLVHEHDAHERLLGLPCVRVGDAERPIASADVAVALAGAEDVRTVIIEVPHREIGGATTTLEDLRESGRLCRERGVALHCDGARLWGVRPHFGCSFAELTAPFDSVYVSFYKGLGAFTGAMLLGSAEFVAEAVVWRKRMGGGVYHQVPYALSCAMGFDRMLGGMEARHAHIVAVAAALTAAFPDQIRFSPPVPTCVMAHVYVRASKAQLEAAMRALAEQREGMVVVDRVRADCPESGECYQEFKMGPLNMRYSVEEFVEGWRALLGLL